MVSHAFQLFGATAAVAPASIGAVLRYVEPAVADDDAFVHLVIGLIVTARASGFGTEEEDEQLRDLRLLDN